MIFNSLFKRVLIQTGFTPELIPSNMKKFLSLAALFSLILGSLAAQQQQVFVLYDASCMLRINYEQAIAQQPRMDYFAYQVPLANGNKLILETGVEGSVRQNYLPPNYLSCNDPQLTADLAEQVNGNHTKVFMLVPEGNDYLIQPVTMGAVMANQGNLFTYVSPLASFQFDTRNVIIGENLAFNNPNARVFFEGRDGNICGGTYLIRQLMPRNAYPVIDYKINPELGVMERRLGSDGASAVGGVTVIRSVGNTPVANYLAVNCGQQGSNAAANGPVTYGSGVVVPPSGYTPPTSVPSTVPQTGVTPQPQPGSVSPQTAVVPQPRGNAAAAEVAMHTVAKGETLYGISRRYNVRVDQVKEWNNLTGNTITVGQSLRVGQATFGGAAAYNAPPVMANRGPVANSNVGAAQPTPYGQVNQPQAVSTPADQEHIVSAGETVASVALRYGYTEAKFREINGLGTNEYLRIGQRLKTSACNCPANAAVQPRSVSTANPAPATYSQSRGGGVVVPQSYQPPVANSAPVGTPVGPTAGTNSAGVPAYQRPGYQTPPAYTPPTPQSGPAYGSPAPSSYGNAPAAPNPYTTAKPAAPKPSTFSNNSSFEEQPKGQVIPNVYRAPSGNSMNSLEGGSTPIVGGSNNANNNFGNRIYTGSSDNTYSSPNTRSVHVVQEGESLSKIAQRYNMTVDQLRSLNNMGRTDVIIPFQRLYIN